MMNFKTNQYLGSSQIKLLILIHGLFLLFGVPVLSNNLAVVEKDYSTKQSEVKLNSQAWKIGINYTFLPLPKLDEGTLKYGNLGFSFDYEVRPKLWLSTGLGVAYWEYHKRTVTRTIDHMLIDPTTKAITYTYIDSVSGITNKFNFISIPARIRLDLIKKKNQTVFVSSGASLNIAFRELKGFEDSSGSGKSTSSPDVFTHSTFGLFDLGYEYKQFQGISTELSLQYRRTLYSQGIPKKGNNYFGFKVGICFYIDQ